MSSFLTKAGKLLIRNGRLLVASDPKDCDCCGDGQLWCCDGGIEGFFCGKRYFLPGFGEMIGDAPVGICQSVKPVADCSECPEPPKPHPCVYLCDSVTVKVSGVISQCPGEGLTPDQAAFVPPCTLTDPCDQAWQNGSLVGNLLVYWVSEMWPSGRSKKYGQIAIGCVDTNGDGIRETLVGNGVVRCAGDNPQDPANNPFCQRFYKANVVMGADGLPASANFQEWTSGPSNRCDCDLPEVPTITFGRPTNPLP